MSSVALDVAMVSGTVLLGILMIIIIPQFALVQMFVVMSVDECAAEVVARSGGGYFAFALDVLQLHQKRAMISHQKKENTLKKQGIHALTVYAA